MLWYFSLHTTQLWLLPCAYYCRLITGLTASLFLGSIQAEPSVLPCTIRRHEVVLLLTAVTGMLTVSAAALSLPTCRCPASIRQRLVSPFSSVTTNGLHLT